MNDQLLSACCQETAYDVLEDIRSLGEHPAVTGLAQDLRAGKFLELVNRQLLQFSRKPGEFLDPEALRPECEGKCASKLLRFPAAGTGLDELQSEAERLLMAYVKDPNQASILPPPLWLRVLPSCIGLLKSLQSRADMAATHCRWLAFNVEQPVGMRSKRISATANINTTGVVLTNPAQWRPLSTILFDIRAAAGNRELKSPYTCWGVRLTGGRSQQEMEQARSNFNPWLEIKVDTDLNATPAEEVAISHVPPSLPFLKDIPFQEIVDNWAGKNKELGPWSSSSYWYCREIQKFYPDSKWPDTGVDCLLCPGIFWSPNNQATASATIFWGFEGKLPDDAAQLLLKESQFLLSGVGQTAGMFDMQVSAAAEGQLRLLHQLPKDLAALGEKLKKYRQEIGQFGKVNGLKPPVFHPPDSMGVMLMFIKAASDKRLSELPVDCAELLRNTWTVEILTEFIERVVWRQAFHRVLETQEIIDARDAGRLPWDQLERIPRPELRLPAPIQLQGEPRGIYPLMLMALRNAFQHSYLATVMAHLATPDAPSSVEYISIEHERLDARREEIRIINSVAGTGGTLPVRRQQRGWQKDLTTFEKLTGRWSIRHGSDSQSPLYSEQIDSIHWRTVIQRQ